MNRDYGSCSMCEGETKNKATYCCAKTLCSRCRHMCDCDGNANHNWLMLNPVQTEKTKTLTLALKIKQETNIAVPLPAGLSYYDPANIGGIAPPPRTEIRRLA
jgi:hypothetical protein